MSYLQNLFGLDGRRALVIGASRGIGATCAEVLVKSGARVVGVARSECSSLGDLKGFEYRQCDITNNEALKGIFRRIEMDFGCLDILVFAAAVTKPAEGDSYQTQVDFDLTLEANLSAAYRCAVYGAQLMKKGEGGSIINITSIGAALGFPGNPGYVASKGGLRQLSKALAMDYARYGIRVNNLAPGYIRTAMTEGSFRDPVRNEERLSRMIIKRWGDPLDLAGAVIFLASNASSYVTGCDIYVDGGWMAKGL